MRSSKNVGSRGRVQNDLTGLFRSWSLRIIVTTAFGVAWSVVLCQSSHALTRAADAHFGCGSKEVNFDRASRICNPFRHTISFPDAPTSIGSDAIFRDSCIPFVKHLVQAFASLEHESRACIKAYAQPSAGDEPVID
jgi:hypothetical protein